MLLLEHRDQRALDDMDTLDVNSHHSSALSFDRPSLPRSETSSPSVSNRRGSQPNSHHEMSDDDRESRNSSILRRSPLMGK